MSGPSCEPPPLSLVWVLRGGGYRADHAHSKRGAGWGAGVADVHSDAVPSVRGGLVERLTVESGGPVSQGTLITVVLALLAIVLVLEIMRRIRW